MKGDLRESAGLDFGWMQACTAPPLSIIASQGRCSGGKKKIEDERRTEDLNPSLFSPMMFLHIERLHQSTWIFFSIRQELGGH